LGKKNCKAQMENISELAKMIDHSLLQPAMTDKEILQGCELAKYYQVAAVCIKPYAIPQVLNYLSGSGLITCAVIGFPHGNSSIRVKEYETEEACKDGAKEIDMVVNIGKVLGKNWDYLIEEIGRVTAVTREYQAGLKVIFENDFLYEDQFKIRLCEICTELRVNFVKTSTGYGFVKGPDGKYSYRGATEHDLILMRAHSGPKVQIKAAGGIRTLDELLWAKSLGATRIGASATEVIMDEAWKRFGNGKNHDSFKPGFANDNY
jgi:deoxyribose-phosphate aldolase